MFKATNEEIRPRHRLVYSLAVLGAIFALALNSLPASAADWYSITLENDIFVGNDNGYSNVTYLSWIDTAIGDERISPPPLVRPLLRSLDESDRLASIRTSTIGQTMITPRDIEIADPDEGELPYAGLLFFNSTYISVARGFSDKLSTVIGIVGPASLAEETQKFVHQLIGAAEPLGWDTQLDNEVVFQFSRARV